MDVLSDVLAAMRAGEPRSAKVEWHAPWGQRFVSIPGSAGFQMVLRGSCWLIPPDGPPVELGAGDVVFFPHGSGYALADSPATPVAEPACDPRDDPRWDRRHVSDVVGRAAHGAQPVTVTVCGGYQLDPSRPHPLLAELPEIVRLRAGPGRNEELRAAVGLLGRELADRRLGADLIVPALLDTLLLYILRGWFEEQGEREPATGWAAALADPVLKTALNAIHGDPAKPWSVETLGGLAGLSRAAFSRRFTALAGRPPMAYLTWWRMTIAARLLKGSEAPLGAIARQVGYTSEYAFANAFKREYGVAPGRYRRGVPVVQEASAS